MAESKACNAVNGNMDQICLARQAILDRRCNVVAYELLFRSPGDVVANIVNSGEATINVITNAFSSIGIDTILGGKKAYINFDSTLLKSDVVRMLPKDKIIIELLESIEIDDSLLAVLRQLHGEGYKFAIDDFTQRENVELLYPFAETIKLDIALHEKETIVEQVKYFQDLNKIILAEKIENQNEFEMCRSLGIKYFQGFFFAKPTVITQGDLPANKQNLIDVMNSVMEDADSRVIEDRIIRDISVSYKLLKFVNSAGLSRGQELNSINEALAMLGRKQLYRWLSILLFSTGESGDKQPNALFNAAIYRGRLMEIFAEESNHKNPSDLFVLGTFSYLEALLNRRMASVVNDMSLPAQIKEALLENDGEYWPYLELAIKLDRDNFTTSLLEKVGLDVGKVNKAQLEATAYCESIS